MKKMVVAKCGSMGACGEFSRFGACDQGSSLVDSDVSR